MEYTIKSGDTLSQIAKAQNTTVEALAKANQIADPNKIIAGNVLKLPEVQQPTGVDMSASEITTGIPEIPQATPEIKPDTTANAILDYTTGEQLKTAEERKKLEETAQKTLGTTDLITASQNRPTIDLATTRTQQLESTGVTALREEVAQQSLKLAGIKGERDRLDIMEQNEIDALIKSGVTRGAIERETTAIQRKYASKKAKLSADLNAEASMLSAMQGNYTMAKEAADQAVLDYVFDYQQKVDTFNNVFNTYSDLISDLNQEEKEILKTAATEAQKELDEIKEEKKEVMALRLQYAGAGISIDDTLEEATAKAEKVQKTPDIIGSADTGYFQWNSNSGKWEATGVNNSTTSSTQKAINNDVAEFILKLESGNIGWGAAFDAMKALHPELSNETIDQLLDKEKRYEYQGSGGSLSKWEIESTIWNWLAGDGATLTSKEKKQRIMEAGLDPSTFNIY